MPFNVSITELVFADDSSLAVPPGGVVALVGPNNAGKSLALREILQHLTQPNPSEPFRSIPQIGVDKDGDAADVESWLRATSKVSRPSGVEQFHRYGHTLQTGSATAWWNGGPPFYGLGQFLCLYLGAGAAAGTALQIQGYNVLTEAPSQPLQYLYADTELEERLSNVVRRAFGYGVALNRFAGTQMVLHVGTKPPPVQLDGAPPREYVEAIANMPLVQNQGDGVRSFVGMLLNVMAAPFQVILLDEPDAFLHPPQAELIGRLLVELKSPSAQLFVATHDANLLRGLLSAEGAALTVIRLDRTGGHSKQSQLAPPDLRELWTDPLLRYSNLLDGLFHSGVVVCESDADCRFYASILDTLNQERSASTDLLFTHTGGKHRMPVAVRAMKAVAVPVVAVTDFDVIQEDNAIRPLVEAFGGQWSEFERDVGMVRSGVESMARPPSAAYVRENVERALASIDGVHLTRADEDRIRGLVRTESGWDRVKMGGVAAIPSGDAANAAVRLLADLARIGIFVVPVGELERWVPGVGGHGPGWVTEVHARRMHLDTDLTVRQFVDAFSRALTSRAIE